MTGQKNENANFFYQTVSATKILYFLSFIQSFGGRICFCLLSEQEYALSWAKAGFISIIRVYEKAHARAFLTVHILRNKVSIPSRKSKVFSIKLAATAFYGDRLKNKQYEISVTKAVHHKKMLAFKFCCLITTHNDSAVSLGNKILCWEENTCSFITVKYITWCAGYVNVETLQDVTTCCSDVAQVLNHDAEFRARSKIVYSEDTATSCSLRYLEAITWTLLHFILTRLEIAVRATASSSHRTL